MEGGFLVDMGKESFKEKEEGLSSEMGIKPMSWKSWLIFLMSWWDIFSILIWSFWIWIWDRR